MAEGGILGALIAQPIIPMHARAVAPCWTAFLNLKKPGGSENRSRGRARPPLIVDRDADAQWGLLENVDALVGLDYELVVPDWLAKSDDLARLALAREIGVWLAPPSLVECVRLIGHLNTGPPARTAAALARLPLAPPLRAYLHRLSPAQDFVTPPAYVKTSPPEAVSKLGELPLELRGEQRASRQSGCSSSVAVKRSHR
jgi:hypothetical protein